MFVEDMRDCFQKAPKHIPLTSLGVIDSVQEQILTISVDTNGIHAIVRTDKEMYYCFYNLNTGRLEHNSSFPISMHSWNCPRIMYRSHVQTMVFWFCGMAKKQSIHSSKIVLVRFVIRIGWTCNRSNVWPRPQLH